MPSRTYVRTQEYKEKIRKSILKIYELNSPPPFGFQKGHTINVGKPRSEKTREKISESHKGKILTEEHKKNLRINHTKGGWHLSKETREKISLSQKGERNTMWAKGWKQIGEKNPMWGRRGEKSPRWLGGISESYQLHRTERQWKKLAKKIRKRDKYICQRCQEYPSYEVHHIIPWRLTHDDNEDNLITLCKSCHGILNQEQITSQRRGK